MQALASTAGFRVPAAIALRGVVTPLRQPAQRMPPGQRRFFAKGDEVFVAGDTATQFFKVVSGTVRTCTLLTDGRRQIEAFHLCGDLFGLESGHVHRFTAEAIDNVEVIAFPRAYLTRLVRDNPEFGDEIMNATLASLDRAHSHMVLLGRRTAQEKIAAFLLDMAQRLAGTDSFEIPMQRADIADYLGLTIETVSRTLTQMARDGLISLAAAGRTVVLANKEALKRLDS